MRGLGSLDRAAFSGPSRRIPLRDRMQGVVSLNGPVASHQDTAISGRDGGPPADRIGAMSRTAYSGLIAVATAVVCCAGAPAAGAEATPTAAPDAVEVLWVDTDASGQLTET